MWAACCYKRQAEKAAGGSRRGPLPAIQPVPRSPGDDKADSDVMDWEPTLAALKQRHVKWVDEEERAKRRREGRCLKCGSPAHYVKACPFGSPRRPGGQAPRPQNPPARVQGLSDFLESAELEEPEAGKA